MDTDYRDAYMPVNRHTDVWLAEAIGMSIHDLGTRLRHARKEREVSQAALAKAVGIKQPSVSELESGETKEMSGPVLLAVCEFLRIRPQWLLHGKGEMDAGPFEDLQPDGRELLARYRQATSRWKLVIRS